MRVWKSTGAQRLAARSSERLEERIALQLVAEEAAADLARDVLEGVEGGALGGRRAEGVEGIAADRAEERAGARRDDERVRAGALLAEEAGDLGVEAHVSRDRRAARGAGAVVGEEARETEEPDLEVAGRERRLGARVERVEEVAREAVDIAAQLRFGHERQDALCDVRQQHRALGARGELERGFHDLDRLQAGQLRAFLPEVRDRDLR